jgi:hypothetical protein
MHAKSNGFAQNDINKHRNWLSTYFRTWKHQLKKQSDQTIAAI